MTAAAPPPREGLAAGARRWLPVALLALTAVFALAAWQARTPRIEVVVTLAHGGSEAAGSGLREAVEEALVEALRSPTAGYAGLPGSAGLASLVRGLGESEGFGLTDSIESAVKTRPAVDLQIPGQQLGLRQLIDWVADRLPWAVPVKQVRLTLQAEPAARAWVAHYAVTTGAAGTDRRTLAPWRTEAREDELLRPDSAFYSRSTAELIARLDPDTFLPGQVWQQAARCGCLDDDTLHRALAQLPALSEDALASMAVTPVFRAMTGRTDTSGRSAAALNLDALVAALDDEVRRRAIASQPSIQVRALRLMTELREGRRTLDQTDSQALIRGWCQQAGWARNRDAGLSCDQMPLFAQAAWAQLTTRRALPLASLQALRLGPLTRDLILSAKVQACAAALPMPMPMPAPAAAPCTFAAGDFGITAADLPHVNAVLQLTLAPGLGRADRGRADSDAPRQALAAAARQVYGGDELNQCRQRQLLPRCDAGLLGAHRYIALGDARRLVDAGVELPLAERLCEQARLNPGSHAEALLCTAAAQDRQGSFAAIASYGAYLAQLRVEQGPAETAAESADAATEAAPRARSGPTAQTGSNTLRAAPMVAATADLEHTLHYASLLRRAGRFEAARDVLDALVQGMPDRANWPDVHAESALLDLRLCRRDPPPPVADDPFAPDPTTASLSELELEALRRVRTGRDDLARPWLDALAHRTHDERVAVLEGLLAQAQGRLPAAVAKFQAAADAHPQAHDPRRHQYWALADQADVTEPALAAVRSQIDAPGFGGVDVPDRRLVRLARGVHTSLDDLRYFRGCTDLGRRR